MVNEDVMQAVGCPYCGQVAGAWCGPMDPLEGCVAPRVGCLHPERVEAYAAWQGAQMGGVSAPADMIGHAAEERLF